MRVILPNPRGFCAGVRMAVDVIDEVLDLFPGRRVFCYHEIVHNKHVVGRFSDRGVAFVERIEDVPEGEIIVFSAHGVSPQVRAAAAARRLTVIDATCPLVTKVHAEAVRYARQGYQILLVGHRGHQEIVGTSGEAPGATQVVESPDDIPRLSIKDPSRLVYLTQTTLSTDDAAIVIDALKAAFPQIKAPPTSDICYATTNRQHAVRQLAPSCDLVLVVGSKNSSNSVRLTEIAANVGTPGRLIDDVRDIDWSWFTGEETVLLTAGASAPEDLVAGVCRALLERFGGRLEVAQVFEERVEFLAPAALRRRMAERGVDPASRRFRVEAPVVTEEIYGAVPLTISAGKNG
ncbi:MAG TPA: 4-hydroxy-3-methylbut-2-enyl diphosphate reductase [Phycisphaerales bacterium]|nr:4-hydroxy-3-methylbut-2-enyl diphosphate reductase [Phycisphaerales bacterium]